MHHCSAAYWWSMSSSGQVILVLIQSLNVYLCFRNSIKITTPEEVLLVCAPSTVDKVMISKGLIKCYRLYIHTIANTLTIKIMIMEHSDPTALQEMLVQLCNQ